MKRRRYGPDADPVSHRVGEDILGRALRKVLNDAQRRLVLDYLHGAPPEQLARQMGCSSYGLRTLLAGLLERLRTSEYGGQLQEELRDPHGPRHSREVWKGAAEVPVHRCTRKGCKTPPFPQKATGRPRNYCSDRCKQAAYRERLREQTVKADGVAPRRPGRAHSYQLRDYSVPPADFPRPERMHDWTAKEWLLPSVEAWYRKEHRRRPGRAHSYQLRDYSVPPADFPRPERMNDWTAEKWLLPSLEAWYRKEQRSTATTGPHQSFSTSVLPDGLAFVYLGSGSTGDPRPGLQAVYSTVVLCDVEASRSFGGSSWAALSAALLKKELSSHWAVASVSSLSPAAPWTLPKTWTTRPEPVHPAWFLLKGAPLPQMHHSAAPAPPLITPRVTKCDLVAQTPWWGPQLQPQVPPGYPLTPGRSWRSTAREASRRRYRRGARRTHADRLGRPGKPGSDTCAWCSR
jgi:hypothetical protein